MAFTRSLDLSGNSASYRVAHGVRLNHREFKFTVVGTRISSKSINVINYPVKYSLVMRACIRPS